MLLVELRGAEHLLHLFAKDIDNPTGDFQVDNFDRLDPVVLEMGGDAPRLALEFKYRLDEICTLRKRQATETTATRRDTLKVKLVFAARCVHLLKEALLNAGGSAPPPEDYQEVQVRDVDMPPKAFDYGPPGPRPLLDRNRGQG